MSGVAALLKYDRKRMVDAADYLAIALVASLPWSTSVTGILTVVWLLVLLPTLDWPALRRELSVAAGWLPVLLVVFAAVGMVWADVVWKARTEGLASHLKLLVIPLLFVQFRRSERGLYAIYALLIACAALLAASYVSLWVPKLQFKGTGTVVKDYISQSGFFTLCVFLLIDMAVTAWREKRRLLTLGFVLLAAAFLANIIYVTTGRTALLVIPILILVYGIRRSWQTALVALLVGAVLAALAWFSSPYLRDRLEAGMAMQTPVHTLQGMTLEPSSNALRLAFWTAAIDIVKQAPVLGHGTGSIRSQFRQHGQAHPGSFVENATNPHQQTLAVAMQLGILGVGVLFAMWFAHAVLFRGPGLVSWFGCIVVTQNIVGSLFNSHLYDFTQGWAYAILVGIAGGMVLRARDATPGTDPTQRVAMWPKGRYEHASAVSAERRTS